MPTFVHSNDDAGHCFSAQPPSDETSSLPPPNRFKKNRDLKFDHKQARLIQEYKRAHRRDAIESELTRDASSSPKLNAEDWRSVFQMGTHLRELTGNPRFTS